MLRQIAALQNVMMEKNIDFWIVPSEDAHGNEYTGRHDLVISYLTGFSGNSGDLLVTRSSAMLWTDGRYFVQAEKELCGSEVQLMRMGEPGVPTLADYVYENIKPDEVLGFFPQLLRAGEAIKIMKQLKKKGVSFYTGEDIAGMLWDNEKGSESRPAKKADTIWILKDEYAGIGLNEKLRLIRFEMRKSGCDTLLITSLDENAWLYNLRGSDIECNPVFFSYSLISFTECIAFLQPLSVNDNVKNYLLSNGVTLLEYGNWTEYISSLSDKKIMLDISDTDYATYLSVCEGNVIKNMLSPAAKLKCVKNPTEIRNMKASHIRDGVILTKFIYWLKQEIETKQNLSETDVSKKLDAMRAEDSRYVSLSFPTISAYRDNAAMCHYEASEESAALLKAEGMYLVDSGAHYLDGTTDVTRTFALGSTSFEEKLSYTLTVMGMLRLSGAIFPEGSRGYNLDSFAREPLWRFGHDFNHGTGHGVGFCGNVHEMPVAIRRRESHDRKYNLPFEPGMVTSDEPGIYIEGCYGIRTENMLLCVRDEKHSGFLAFETLTYVPLDRSTIIPDVMEDRDIGLYNEYQKNVYEKISPYLNCDEREWLKNETARISR